MSIEPEPFRGGCWRFRCRFSLSWFGPSFPTESAARGFAAWYDGDPRYIGTWLEPRDWDKLVRKFYSRYPSLRPKRIRDDPKRRRRRDDDRTTTADGKREVVLLD